jgi:ribosomal protein L12E/L44/L45/RPP1/RPP2
MQKVPPMVDLKRTPAEKEEIEEGYIPTSANIPDYPFSLSISLCEDELQKLGLDVDDFEVDDLVHFHAMAVVTSVSQSSNQNGDNARIELQITHMSAEDEDEENEEEEEEEDAPVLHKLYK